MEQLPKGFPSTKVILKGLKKATANRDLFKELYDDVLRYCAPNLNSVFDRANGERHGQEIYDETAPQALPQFANRMQATLVPSEQKWIDFGIADIKEDQLEEEDRKNLSEMQRAFFEHLSQTNFSAEVEAAFLMLGVGTGGLILDELPLSERAIGRWVSVPIAEIAPEPTLGGAVENVWREYKISYQGILDTWPDAEIPDAMQKKMEADPYKECKVSFGQKKFQGRYHMLVILDKNIIWHKSYDTKRFIVFRWSVHPGESLGRGPGVRLISAIEKLNKIQEYLLKNSALNIGGVFTAVSDGVFNPFTATLEPNTIIPVTSNNNQNPTIKALERTGDPALAQFEINDFREVVRKGFFADPMGEINDPVRSATEQMLRHQEMMKNAGAALSRMKTEFIDPVVEAWADLLKSRGKFPQLSVATDLKIVHMSPVAKGQKAEEFQSLQVFLQMLGSFPPEIAAAAVKVEELPEMMRGLLNLPPEIIRDEEDREKVGKSLVEQQVNAEAAPDQVS